MPKDLKDMVAEALPGMPPVTPPATPEEPPAPPAPKYAAGEQVQPAPEYGYPAGQVESAGGLEQCYAVKCGDRTVMLPESKLSPAVAEAPEMAALREELAKVKAQASRADAEAKAMALEAAGVTADLRATVEATLSRQDGETWAQAVARDKTDRPSAYQQQPAVQPQAKLPAGATLPPPAKTPKQTGAFSVDGTSVVR